MNVKGVGIGGRNPVRIMGIVNLSPESFYDESIATTTDDLQERIRLMEAQGADIIDVGGASTAPKDVYGTPRITEKEEIDRISSAIGVIADTTDLPLSIDTTSAAVAEIALDMGASLVNDVSGLREDERMSSLVAARDVPVVLMANCQEGCRSINESLISLQQSLKIAKAAQIKKESIILDPGIGFGKPPDVDFAILRELHKYTSLGYPLLVGVSRKAFLGSLLEFPEPSNRLIGTIAATAIAVVNGADVIRAHDIPEAVNACRVAEAILGNP